MRPPLVTPKPASATRGKDAKLRFELYDDSGYSAAVVQIYEGGSVIGRLASPDAFAIGSRSVALRWPVPAKLRSRRLRFCVIASDRAGNRSAPTCAPFLRVS